MSSYRSHVVAPSRVFDHLYDPTFTTSSPKNLYRENCIALTRSAPIHVHPSDRGMFSELQYEPRNFYVYQRNVLPNLPSISSEMEMNNASGITSQPPAVTGADRSKFFATPSCNSRTINVGLMAQRQQQQTMTTRIEIEKSTTAARGADGRMRTKSTCIQTLYRESSAQTRPWLPEITCYADTNEEDMDDAVPEVVYVADLIDSTITYPGLREVEIVERARKRRMWENALPPIESADDIPGRAAALEAFEWEEWLAREKEINECQQARLKIVADLMEKREKKHLMDTNQKLENCKRRILEERKHKKDILIRNYQRSMRKLDLAKRRSSNSEKLKDPVLSHYDRKMEYSFPKIRLDAFTKKRTTQFEYSNDFQTKFKLIEEENSPSSDLHEYLKDNKRQLWRPKTPTKEVERGIWNENYLKKLHETLKQFRQKKYTKRKQAPPKCMIFEDVRPDPAENGLAAARSRRKSSVSHIEATDEIYQNLVHIQKNIKGRAIQSLLERGVKRFREVIDEAKETHSIAAIKKLFPPEFVQHMENHESILDEYKRVEEALKNDTKLHEELRKVESRDAGNLLNFLERELRRLDGEKRSHALYLLAERERYCRQATSMGESEFDEQFKSDAVTLYLENVLMEGIRRATTTTANEATTREYIQRVAAKIDRKANKNVTFHEDENEEFSCESNTESVTNSTTEINEIPDQSVVAEMLKDGMMPSMLSRIKSEQMTMKRKKLLLAAHQTLFSEECEQMKAAEEKSICVGLFDEIVDVAMEGGEGRSARESSIESENSSKVANELAGEIVKNILNEMIDSNFQFSSTTGESSFSGDSYDGDYSNIQSTDGDSTAEFLANQVVRNVLDEIMELSFTSSSTRSECASSDTN